MPHTRQNSAILHISENVDDVVRMFGDLTQKVAEAEKAGDPNTAQKMHYHGVALAVMTDGFSKTTKQLIHSQLIHRKQTYFADVMQTMIGPNG